jgi:type VI secretion system protein ImpC
MQMESWQELANPRDLTKIFENTEYTAWRSLRNSEDSRYLGLTMPRFLARLPYGVKTNPIDEFDFEESTDGSNHGAYCWANSAYAMAVNINRSFKYYGWCSSIRGVESGGAVEDRAGGSVSGGAAAGAPGGSVGRDPARAGPGRRRL